MIDRNRSGAVPSEGYARANTPRPSWWRRFLLPAVLFVLVFLLAATLAVNARALSPYDEAAHFDYIVKIFEGTFPVPTGERYSDEAIQVWACRPADKSWSISPLCGVPDASGDWRIPLGGVNYEAPFGPIYYLLAAAGSAGLRNVGIEEFMGARLVSSALYALGATLLLLVTQRMALSSVAAGGLILAASSTPLVLSLGATVTPDSVALVGAAAVIASALLSPTWRSAVLATTVVCAVGGLTKPNFIVIAVLGSIMLILRWISLERPTALRQTIRRLLAIGPAAALPLMFGAASSAGWATLAESRNTTGLPADGGFHVSLQSDLGAIDRAAQQLAVLLRPDSAPAFSMLEGSPVLTLAGQVVTLLILGACLCAWLWRVDADERGVTVLRSVAIALPASAVVLVAILWISYQGGHGLSPRWGLPLFAAATAGLGASLPRRAAVPVGILGLAVWLCAWASVSTR